MEWNSPNFTNQYSLKYSFFACIFKSSMDKNYVLTLLFQCTFLFEKKLLQLAIIISFISFLSKLRENLDFFSFFTNHQTC